MTEPFRFKLTDEQKQIVGTVRELTQGEFKGRGLAYMNGAFPWENIRRLGVYIMAETFSLMTMPKPDHLISIININRGIAAGLRGKA